MRLTTGFWVKAYLRRVEAEGAVAMLVRRGFETAGGIVLKVNRLDGAVHLLTPVSDPDGARRWMTPLGGGAVEEAQADGWIERAVRRDPDLWVIEVEDRQGRHFLDDPVDSGEPG